MLTLQNLDGTVNDRWNGARVTDLAITEDGKRMVAICHEKKIRIYDLAKRLEVASISEANPITSVCLTHDGKHAIVNVTTQVSDCALRYGFLFIYN